MRQIKNIIISLILIFIASSGLVAKDDKIKRNSVYVEFLGTGLGFSLNGETLIKSNLSLRVGLAYAIWGAGYILSSTYLIGKDKNHFEVGLSLSYMSFASLFGGGTSSQLIPGGILGYRYQPKKTGGFFFRATFTPFVVIKKNEYQEIDYNTGQLEIKTDYIYEFQPWGGVSVGFCF
ncbi:MAG: hypothetical protein NZ928_00855 [Endomicrobia bacterium]|nr:hypothetical protein [Endomicrobiia bacterium]MDW8056413.1 hypothetical protein [Elusimicrobiota bacterium]